MDVAARTFTKKEIRQRPDVHGESPTAWMAKQTLKNEFEALKFIRKNAKIRVPSPIQFRDDPDGASVVMDFVYGVSLENLPAAVKVKAIPKVELYINTVVLPQLDHLRSRWMGSLTADVIPPPRVLERCPGNVWARRRTEYPSFVFCHNDLAQHNILCHPGTGEVVCIIDWEFAGFYHPKFENRLWSTSIHVRVNDPQEVDTLEHFLRGPNRSSGLYNMDPTWYSRVGWRNYNTEQEFNAALSRGAKGFSPTPD